ncbi:LysR family transcriptional regulator [Chelativorans sp. J32]|uniref:LysR family transcriptional regulator n=1 Tax=Chelativorans sp. J32 TaxID=935840 RepID=UPI0012EC5535|nr:LysR family transcriptional regulator [Chelativorans sp. J32]
MLNVTLRRMEVFVAIVDEGSFAAAADRFGIAQPSISAHIRALERMVGGDVFERRRGRKPVLTDLGRSILLHARELLAEADDMRADVVKLRNATGHRVVLSCQRSLANYALKQQITGFALSHPEVQLVVRIGKQEDVIDEVRDGIADVGCFLSNEETRGLRSDVIGFEKLVLVASPTHPLAGRKRIKPREIERYDFVGPPPSSRFGRAVSKLLASAGIGEVKVAAQATEYHFLREFVAAGVGISCSLARSVEADVARGLLTILDFDGPELTFQIRQIASLRRQLSSGADQLMEFLRSDLKADDPSRQ